MATTKRRRRHAREKALLTHSQEMDLLIGDGSAFKSDQERREAWMKNREYIMSIEPFSHARIVFELGGFLPEEGGRIRLAEARIKKAAGEKHQ